MAATHTATLGTLPGIGLFIGAVVILGLILWGIVSFFSWLLDDERRR